MMISRLLPLKLTIFLLMGIFFVMSAYPSQVEESTKKEVEEMLSSVQLGKAFEKDLKKDHESGRQIDPDIFEGLKPNSTLLDKAARKRDEVLPILIDYLNTPNCERREAAIRLIGGILQHSEHIYGECCPTLPEEVYVKFLSIVKNKEKEDKWTVDAAAKALSYVKDVRIILPLIEAIEYYDDIIIKERLAQFLFEITHNGKFVINMFWDSPEEVKKIVEYTRKWYEKNKGKMYFDVKGRFRLGDPKKYKPPVKSTEPSEKVIKGYIKIIEGLFDVKLTKKEKEIVRQDVIYMYKHEEEEDKEADWGDFEYFIETADEEAWDEMMKDAKEGLQHIRTGHPEYAEAQGSFCSSYEEGKELGYETPGYELIHRLCKDLFGNRYDELIKGKK